MDMISNVGWPTFDIILKDCGIIRDAVHVNF